MPTQLDTTEMGGFDPNKDGEALLSEPFHPADQLPSDSPSSPLVGLGGLPSFTGAPGLGDAMPSFGGVASFDESLRLPDEEAEYEAGGGGFNFGLGSGLRWEDENMED